MVRLLLLNLVEVKEKNGDFLKNLHFFAIFPLQNGIYRVQYSKETQHLVVFRQKRGKKPLKIASFYM